MLSSKRVLALYEDLDLRKLTRRFPGDLDLVVRVYRPGRSEGDACRK